IAGAALVTQRPGGPFLDLLFVLPRWHRQGVATALVASVLCALAESGADHLTSRYHLANAPSRTWHHAFGFVDLPNLRVARAHHRCARHALHYAASSITTQERDALKQEVAHWRREVERLERIAEAEGLDAVLKREDIV
ncbi:MAG TPA: GNAT family N-acetyltransferase, partial [Rhodothermales bacterium]|nr:GNAT family N-acetyltransferase [Rhodothermales bacterium]